MSRYLEYFLTAQHYPVFRACIYGYGPGSGVCSAIFWKHFFPFRIYGHWLTLKYWVVLNAFQRCFDLCSEPSKLWTRQTVSLAYPIRRSDPPATAFLYGLSIVS